MKIINRVWEHDEIAASKPSSAHSDDSREISNEDNKRYENMMRLQLVNLVLPTVMIAGNK